MNYAINLTDLDKETFKQNLISYLKTTTIGKEYDLDSEGTAIKMLVDLFSYNSLIWMHYLHMVNKESFISTAQRNDSISKLLQVIGFTLSNKNSAIALVSFTKISSGAQYLDRFAVARGKNPTNSFQNFYYVGPTVTIDSTTTVPFYGGDSLVKEVQITVTAEQEYKINNENVDIRTICVSVNGEYWTNYTNNPVQDTNENSKIFFIVKKGKYFCIKFGKDIQGENFKTIGKEIAIGEDTVLVSYVISSGSSGNSVIVNEFLTNNTSASPATTIISTLSSGGYDSPDLEYIKYIAPRYYGYQALVTKSDFEAAIISSGYITDYEEIENKVVVYDGQNHNNNYGKIYFSAIGYNVGDTEVESILTFLKSKIILGLSIEYKESENFIGNITISATRDSSKTKKSIGQLRDDLVSAIEEKYSILKFNNSISKSNLILLGTDVDPSIVITDSNITFTFDKTIDLSQNKTLYFYNPISSFTTELVSTNLSTSDVRFKSTTIDVPNLNGFKYIGAYLSNNTAVNEKVGVFNPTTGFMIFNDNIVANDSFDITITPNTVQITPLNNMAVEYRISSVSMT
jgi:hypothetical protein